MVQAVSPQAVVLPIIHPVTLPLPLPLPPLLPLLQPPLSYHSLTAHHHRLPPPPLSNHLLLHRKESLPLLRQGVYHAGLGGQADPQQILLAQ